jgi:hypothetical protein
MRILSLVLMGCLLSGCPETPTTEDAHRRQQYEAATEAWYTTVLKLRPDEPEPPRSGMRLGGITVHSHEFSLKDGTPCVVLLADHDNNVTVSCGWGMAKDRQKHQEEKE